MKKVIIGCLLLLSAAPAMAKAEGIVMPPVGQTIILALIVLACLGVCVFLPSFAGFIILNIIFSEKRTYSRYSFAPPFIIALIWLIAVSIITAIEGFSLPFLIASFIIIIIAGTYLGWREAGKRVAAND